MSGDDNLALVLRIPVFFLRIIVYTLTYKDHFSISIIIFSLIFSASMFFAKYVLAIPFPSAVETKEGLSNLSSLSTSSDVFK